MEVVEKTETELGSHVSSKTSVNWRENLANGNTAFRHAKHCSDASLSLAQNNSVEVLHMWDMRLSEDHTSTLVCEVQCIPYSLKSVNMTCVD